jgi:hypothetical protein
MEHMHLAGEVNMQLVVGKARLADSATLAEARQIVLRFTTVWKDWVRTRGCTIRTREDYDAALARFDDLIRSIPGSPEAFEADRLALALERYEQSAQRRDLAAWSYVLVAVTSLATGFMLGNSLYTAIF